MTDPIVFERRVLSGLDDVEQLASGGVATSSSDLELVDDGSNIGQIVGIRFTGIDIPQGAIITSAYIQFQTDEAGSSATSLLIRGEDTDDAAAFAKVNYNVSSRATTDASAAWSPAAWTTAGTADMEQRTPSLMEIVQEIVDRSGWATGNDMVFVITGTGKRTAEAYEGSAAGAPLLHIEYTIGSPVAFNDPADSDGASDGVGELAAAGALVGITASATDIDGDAITYSVGDLRFAIDPTTGVISRSNIGALDFESEPTIALTVTATSSDGSTASKSFNINISDQAEPMWFNPDADPNANRIAENALANTLVGITASATDIDGDAITYAINDPRFTIDAETGVIARSSVGALDFESEPTITIGVSATSKDATASRSFILQLDDAPDPVVFNTPADANAATNQIAENAAAGSKLGITASASDPDSGSTVVYEIDDPRFAIDPTTGVITRSSEGTLDFENEPTITFDVTATSPDSTATHSYTLSVTSGQPPSAVSLVRTTQTSQWSPPSPDPSDIVYINHLGTLIVSDGEVDEMSIFKGDNLFEMRLDGSLKDSLTTIRFSDEPAGIAYNPSNHHLFISDDTGTRGVYELDPGKDGLYDTKDDSVTFVKSSAFGNKDPEGIAYDTNRGVLYIIDGAGNEVYTVNPGANGRFDGVPSTGGDDVVTHFDTARLGITDPEGIAYDPDYDLLYIIANRKSVAQVSTTGELLGMIDISAANARKPAGLALAPSSLDPNGTSLYIVDRGVDNDSNPNENDGKVFEFQLDWLLS